MESWELNQNEIRWIKQYLLHGKDKNDNDINDWEII
jgi:hypothetical protein